MDMKFRILSAAAFAMSCPSWLPAADPQLLNLVMPDAKIVGGVNVDQAKASPFGQYVVRQLQGNDPELQEIAAQTGFDPTRDLHELLLASNGTQPHGTVLILARGIFDPSKIAAAAENAGGTTETYKGVTIVEDRKNKHGFTFLNSTLAVAGDIPNVKAAIDRQAAPAVLPAALLVQINQWSTTEDAWAISEVPLPAVQAPANNPNLPSIPPNTFQSIQQSTAGVKFGSQVLITSQLQADTAQNATSLAAVLQFLVNLAQMKAQQDPQAAAALQSATITTKGNLVNVSLSVPEAQAEALFQLHPKPTTAERSRAKLGRRL